MVVLKDHTNKMNGLKQQNIGTDIVGQTEPAMRSLKALPCTAAIYTQHADGKASLGYTLSSLKNYSGNGND